MNAEVEGESRRGCVGSSQQQGCQGKVESASLDFHELFYSENYNWQTAQSKGLTVTVYPCKSRCQVLELIVDHVTVSQHANLDARFLELIIDH
jgi:hypothetical protein